ncbi:penicillin-binding transpeptidase domain-containing protein [Enterococcus faecium]|uniref:penicillin-binding transpeptidase domain-containing protein n=1 Tax=Enterococcus sp. HMSC072F02 TaxID=1715210 RepID=UPI0008A98D2F|nr:penicillin-binding transpeptidase domain-containing protein [Enterococcus sp. HMSC072F02]MDB7280301.1 penicillin-binding transpeptidase domain-containing protein [Enterococcus faecium]MDB7283069.1 penicillin-binding transpeptidase domain-containing protein [Enterococcus faecium]MDB7288029.1 penicillin-binding transpeptidase domain-containing protein [Enterococcus faecium]MDB7293239.1 penicillin-binding transpeptidase domain-containing protein [Enterococcus faecium]MDB7303105.1 penicillin-bi
MSLKNKIRRFMEKKNLNPMNNRKKVGIILFATSIGLFFLFAVRFSYIVIGGHVAGTSLAEKTKQLYQGSEVVKAKRGTIYDRNGVALAEDASSYSIKAILSKTYTSGDKKLYVEEKNFDKIAEILHKNLSIDKKDALNILEDGAKKELYQVEFGSYGKNISQETKQNIEADMKKEGVAGLYFVDHQARMYPNGVFSSHFIGYAVPDKDENGLVGKLGLESAYNDILSGKDGKIIYQKDNFQNPLPGTVAEEEKAVDGQDIYTTLDSRLQSYLETLMDQVNEEYQPEELTVVLMKAKTGEILAMGQRPTFNPETMEGLTGEDAIWRNFLVQDSYEPGSTMKVFTTAAAIEEGEFNENETFQSGKIQVEDATINDHDFGEKGVLTMRQALSWSSNVGMVILEQRLGGRWYNYLQKLGFGQSTYSGLDDEVNGALPTSNIVDRAMSAYGQAVGVTNFQMMKAFTSIANNGTMIQPRYISKVVDPQTGEERTTQTEVLGQPFSKETTEKVREYMRDVVESENYGSAYGVYSVPGYNVSAKTGTAQIASDTGGYQTGDTAYLYSIVEMVPSEDPDYVLYLTMKHPKTYDRMALAKIANPLMKRAMDFKETEEDTDTETKTEKVSVADYRNLEADVAAADAQKSGLQPVVIGNGKKVQKQSTANGDQLISGEKLILYTGGDKLMPDVTGWSKADIMKLGKILGIEVSFDGDGYCVKQELAPYEKITKEKLNFTLEE